MTGASVPAAISWAPTAVLSACAMYPAAKPATMPTIAARINAKPLKRLPVRSAEGSVFRDLSAD